MLFMFFGLITGSFGSGFGFPFVGLTTLSGGFGIGLFSGLTGTTGSVFGFCSPFAGLSTETTDMLYFFLKSARDK